jgi:hypothetical protein
MGRRDGEVDGGEEGRGRSEVGDIDTLYGMSWVVDRVVRATYLLGGSSHFLSLAFETGS